MKSIKPPQWMMTNTNFSLVLSQHFWMTFCWQKGACEMLSSGFNSTAQMLAHGKFLSSMHVPAKKNATCTHKYVMGVVILLAWLFPSGSIYPSDCRSYYNVLICVGSLKHTYTHTRMWTMRNITCEVKVEPLSWNVIPRRRIKAENLYYSR